ncbi:MAG: DEAD/DEAH box helicase [Deltaproteobacteria bacterium]|jgi:ATP-dependent DNA helicase RecG|nr:DEAD/DEAH box helicase [Deltaproteobacteria bacterium]
MNFFSAHNYLSSNLSVLDGLGPKRVKYLASKGLEYLWQLFILPPASYQDRRQIKRLSQAKDGEELLFCGRIDKVSLGPNMHYLKVEVSDGDEAATLWWFQSLSYYQKRLTVGQSYHIYGRTQLKFNRFNLSHPEIWPTSDGPQSAEQLTSENQAASQVNLGIFPVYRIMGILSAPLRRKLIDQIFIELDRSDRSEPLFPEDIVKKYGLSQPINHLKIVHYPPKTAKGRLPKPKECLAWKALSTLELALWRLVITSSRPPSLEQPSTTGPDPKALAGIEEMWRNLPFEPSPEQNRVTTEILSDLAAATPMNRLLQGEVGCGKTAVAAAAVVSILALGRQAAVMAPTEILARQHFAFFSRLGQAMGFTVHYLAGTQSVAERRKVLSHLDSGAPSVTIGTQALCYSTVTFHDLGLAVIDEQHRFGVRQRLALRNKCPEVNLLSLSATPIPASLSSILYGDLDLSSMIGILPGRSKPITTVYKQNKASEARALLAKLVKDGQQAFVVCPRISKSTSVDVREPGNDEPSDPTDPTDKDESNQPDSLIWSDSNNNRAEVIKTAEELSKLLPDFEVGVLHGRLPAAEKNKVMDNFRSGKMRVLVATTMVEVGVDIPAANVMLVEGADYFGLAQLHQLRGRIGRGGGQGYFLLIPSKQIPSPITQARLEAITSSYDGYSLAEMDLKLRGPGEELGLKQSGWPTLDFAKLPQDLPLLAKAFELAQDLWNNQESWNTTLARTVQMAADDLAQDQPDEPVAPEPPAPGPDAPDQPSPLNRSPLNCSPGPTES